MVKIHYTPIFQKDKHFAHSCDRRRHAASRASRRQFAANLPICASLPFVAVCASLCKIFDMRHAP
ncbi:MAG: hypothetical protein LBL83_09520 [Clostridiales bacterium]|nr:hypothetical protein [Clostridiales bacterium]